MNNAVLFVSPSVEDAWTLASMLEPVGISFSHVTDLTQAKNLLAAKPFDAVLTDAHLRDGSWKDVVRLVSRMKRRVAVVVTALVVDARFWVDVLEHGVHDLLPKPFSRGEVQRVLAGAVHSLPLLAGAASA